MSSLVECREAAPRSFLLPFGAAFRRVVRGFGGVARAFEGRRVLSDLASFDDRMLKDIGLSRSDLRNAAAEPIFRDPTAILAGRVEESRGRRGRPPRPVVRGNVISY